MHTRLFAAVALSLGLIAPASAQDVVGTITGTVIEQATTWQMLSGGDDKPGLWLPMGGGMNLITLFADPLDPPAPNGGGDLHLSFGVMKAGDQTIFFNVEVSYFSPTSNDFFTAPADEGTVLTLTSMEEGDGGIKVQGEFSTTVFLMTDTTTGKVDRDQAIAITGQFDSFLAAE